MNTSDAMYKIAYQLVLNRIHIKYLYEEALQDLGEDHSITEHRKQQVVEAEEAEKLFGQLKDQLMGEVEPW